MRRMVRLINPLTGEVKLTTWLDAKRLRSYGWQDMPPESFAKYQEAVMSYLAAKQLKNVVRH